jgi:hypothetical protein
VLAHGNHRAEDLVAASVSRVPVPVTG